MSKERDILKSLLFKEELELLDNLKQKVLSEAQFTEEVSKVLSAAIIRARKQDKEFERSISGPIKRGVIKSFADNKQSLIDAIMPIMGQLIRKSVSNSIKQFVSDINRTLELAFSTKALKWRWQSIKTGETFADIVFQKTTHYQITEMFVINHENGLLIQHVGTDAGEILKDNDALSAMLTVLQDFIGDSIKSSDSGLLSIEVSDKQFLISTGPQAYLATVVKGLPTERLKERLQQLIEYIHSDFSELLSDQDQYQNSEEFSDYLQKHLITKSISESEKKLNWKPWAILALLTVLILSYWTYHRNQQFDDIELLSHSIPGLYVQEVKRQDDGFVVTGLMDPVADDSQLLAKNVKLMVRPYVSLDKEIIQTKVNKKTAEYQGIVATVQGNTVILSGELKEEESQYLMNQLITINGIDKIDNQIIIDNTDAELIQLKQTIKDMKYFINNTIINLPKLLEENAAEKHKLNKIVENSQFIIKNQSQTLINIIGESDCHGQKSDAYSLQRADLIKDTFVKNNIKETSLSVNIKPCAIFMTNENSENKNVMFKIK